MALIPNPLIIPVGLIVGILVAAPVGPVNLLCIQRAIERGFWGGVAAGVGSVLGDGLIALAAVFGIGVFADAFRHAQTFIAIQTIGGLALIGYGLRLFFTRPRLAFVTPEMLKTPSLGDYIWEIPQTFFLTITNPAAVLGLFAIFGAVRTFVGVETIADEIAMVIAIMAGGLAWWFGLSYVVSRIRHRLAGRQLEAINRVAGLLLIGFGGVLVAEVIVKNVLFLGWS